MINMECDTCPVKEECRSARRVAIRSVGDDMVSEVLDLINRVCPIEEMMYATFVMAVHNAKREIADG